MNTDDKIITIGIDDIKILTCTHDNLVYLEGDFIFNDEDMPCVIIMKRSQFLKVMNDILDKKKHYNVGGSFAGVGSIWVDEYIEVEKEKRAFITYVDDEEVKNVEVDTFIAKKISVEMEHG